jgi:transcriptional regulator with XRE-family HTH domain
MNTDLVYRELKQYLKAANLTYADIARSLELSEASVKRLFAEQTLSLQRIEVICDWVGITLSELMLTAERQSRVVDELSREQEQEIVDNPLLLVVSICVTNRLPFDTIIARYDLTTHQLVQLLAQLDRMGIIELLPLNRYRLKITRNFRWRDNGPIEQYFYRSVLPDFYKPGAHDEWRHHRFAWGLLSEDQLAELRNSIDALISNFVTATSPRGEVDNQIGTAVLLSMRGHWEPADFRAIRKA